MSVSEPTPIRREFDPNDQQILEITKQLCQEIGISDYSPTFVSWEMNKERGKPWGRPVEFDVDDCLIEHYCVTLSAKMRDLLKPEDWKPIIASGLIFSKKLRKRILKFLLLVILAFGIVDAFVYSTMSTLFPQVITYTGRSGYCCYTTTLGGALAFPVGIAIILLGTIVSMLLFVERTRLLADRLAANLVGRETFLNTLNKINEAVGQQVRRSGPLPPLPSRMKRLSSTT